MKKIFYFSIVLILFVSACTRISSTDIGGGLIPPIDGVTTKDTTFDITTDLFENFDSARIYKLDNQVLGYLNDPLFGKTNASMFFELKPSFFPFVFPVAKDSILLDSVVLILSARGFYGDTTQPLTLNVNEISPTANFDYLRNYPANYPPNPSIDIAPTALVAPTTLNLRRIGDSVNNRFENAKNQIRIPLNKSFGQRLINYDSTNAYASDSAMRNYFRGFRITANTTGNALLKVNLQDTNTKLALYYNYKRRDTANKGRDTIATVFRFNNFGSGLANIVTRDRAGSQIVTYLNPNNQPDSLLYLQTTPGTFARLRVNKGLINLGNNIIHRAEIVVQQVQDATNNLDKVLTPPRYLLLSTWDSTVVTPVKGILKNIPGDYTISQSGPNVGQFGGFIVYKDLPTQTSTATYTFDVSRYVQGIVTRKDSLFDMRLYAPSNDSISYSPPYPNNLSKITYTLTPGVGNDAADGRVRVGGGNHSRFRMRLRVIYSKL